ncbi:juvenile hormone epoxide hydrolase 1-like isoform X2 [Topomyia yanbarensis]|nr:juvenile hormone epoxide hydrolase 1-like isoform X2 [Topomyia yanbarensis]XP_058818174.1 juvenile hormone epoxide hydrolase 1-like isoform X2 [Topomyia yanbarensis]XP_058818175.1 juvenile hormone epoxide hydrolase 1-like isoform X2 [Topomyia yanbarensis]
MGFTGRVFFVVLLLMVAVGYKQYQNLTVLAPPPTVKELDQYWGPGDGKLYKEDPSIKPFKIAYTTGVIEKLRTKLNDTPNLVPPLEGVAFEYGFNSNHLKEIVTYWKTEYLDKWNTREKYLNQFPHFKTQIQGLDIHFIHVKPKVPAGTKVLPLLLLHGWPGSVREFYEIIPKLTSKTDDKDFVFEVVVPSLPGYGWSQAAAKQGMSTSRMALIMKRLMDRVGHQKFYVQGGDWGSLIGSQIAAFFPDNVIGVHLNMCAVHTPLAILKTIIASFRPSLFVEEKYVDLYFPALPKLKELVIESGYMHLQATKPDTVGTALVGNPVGLAAYILEKFSTWTNPAYRELADGGLLKYFTLDSLLDNIMIYYLTDTITTSQRLYYETFTIREMAAGYDRVPRKVPSACAKFKYELAQTVDWALRDSFVNLVQSNHFDDGGHFAAMQLPAVLYKDVVEFVKKTV